MQGRTITILIILIGILGISCSDELNELTTVGGFPRTDVIIRDTTVYATTTSSFRERTATNGLVNYIGKSGNYTSYALIQFYQSLFPNRDTVLVTSAKLKLRAVAWFGDSTGTVAFTVHKVTESWSETTLDSLPAYEAAVRGTFNGFITADTTEIVVDLDTALVREWIRPATFTQYGILLVPASNSSVLRGFHCFNFDSAKFYPTLEIIGRNVSGTVWDTASFSLGIDTFIGENAAPVSNSELLYTQSGAVHRSSIKFDVGFIPAGAIVNSAEMILVRDPASSRLNKFTPDSTLVTHLRTSETETKQIETFGMIGDPGGSIPNSYSFDIRHAVQRWAVGTNYGIVLRAANTSEFGSFDLFTFYNHTASDSTLRPSLRVRYAVEGGLN